MKSTIIKKLILPLVLISALLVQGCKKNRTQEELQIDLAAIFQDDFVTITLDGNQIFSDTISTNAIVGVAEIIKLNYPIGKLDLNVNVNGVSKTQKYTHKVNGYIVIGFNESASDISITYPKAKILYD